MHRSKLRPGRASSINGLEIAATAAVSTRFSPEASPPPNMALPFSRMTARTSAKIKIDQTFLDDKVADAGHTRIKHLIG